MSSAQAWGKYCLHWKYGRNRLFRNRSENISVNGTPVSHLDGDIPDIMHIARQRSYAGCFDVPLREDYMYVGMKTVVMAEIEKILRLG